MGLPYPTLPVFAQSLLATNDVVGFTDLIDGMDLTSECGAENLDFDSEYAVEWVQRKHEKIRASVPLTPTSFLLEVPTNTYNLKEEWNEIVGTKEKRIGEEMAEAWFVTRFSGRGKGDPREEERIDA